MASKRRRDDVLFDRMLQRSVRKDLQSQKLRAQLVDTELDDSMGGFEVEHEPAPLYRPSTEQQQAELSYKDQLIKMGMDMVECEMVSD